MVAWAGAGVKRTVKTLLPTSKRRRDYCPLVTLPSDSCDKHFATAARSRRAARLKPFADATAADANRERLQGRPRENRPTPGCRRCRRETPDLSGVIGQIGTCPILP